MKALIATTIVSMMIIGCDADTDSLYAGGRRRTTDGDDATNGSTSGADPTQPGSCQEGVPHPGFANVDFVADRAIGAIGADRRRVKPHSALQTEFQRALGRVPEKLASSAAAYGEVPARWYAEPTAGAVSLYTTYTLAFSTCYDTMDGAPYTEMPSASVASTECAKMQRKFWQRTPTPDETQGCVDLAVGLQDEPVARRRWAHACASILTSAGFTTY